MKHQSPQKTVLQEILFLWDWLIGQRLAGQKPCSGFHSKGGQEAPWLNPHPLPFLITSERRMEICPLAGNKTKVPAMPSLAVFLCPGWWNRGLNLLMRNQWVHGKNPEAPLLLLCHSSIPHTHTLFVPVSLTLSCFPLSLSPSLRGGFLTYFPEFTLLR